MLPHDHKLDNGMPQDMPIFDEARKCTKGTENISKEKSSDRHVDQRTKCQGSSKHVDGYNDDSYSSAGLDKEAAADYRSR